MFSFIFFGLNKDLKGVNTLTLLWMMSVCIYEINRNYCTLKWTLQIWSGILKHSVVNYWFENIKIISCLCIKLKYKHPYKNVSETLILSNRIRFRDYVFIFQQMIHVCGTFTNKKSKKKNSQRKRNLFFFDSLELVRPTYYDQTNRSDYLSSHILQITHNVSSTYLRQ